MGARINILHRKLLIYKEGWHCPFRFLWRNTKLAWTCMRTTDEGFGANKGTSKDMAVFVNSPGVRPESCALSKLVKGQSAQAKACGQ